MRHKSAPGIIGPAAPQQVVSFDLSLPDCVQMKTGKDQEDFRLFIEDIGKKVAEETNKSALDQIAQFVKVQNEAMNQLVRKLGER